MAKKKSSIVAKSKTVAPAPEARSTKLAERGVTNLMESAEFTMAVALDVARGAMANGSANAIASNVGKTLKAVEIQQKYGPKGGAALPLLAAPR